RAAPHRSVFVANVLAVRFTRATRPRKREPRLAFIALCGKLCVGRLAADVSARMVWISRSDGRVVQRAYTEFAAMGRALFTDACCDVSARSA
ncbi:hypothetical protein, partial [Paraburkholderia bengalensis]|uniref:hypothetical protein n=1 Tax=Paraburkholderia bengalensis TaxID=2747562 RepID=UPI00301476FA